MKKVEKKVSWWIALTSGATGVIGFIIVSFGGGWFVGTGIGKITSMLIPTGHQYSVADFLHVTVVICIIIILLEKLFVCIGKELNK
ncbi:MAG: hypothetical protein V1709_10780 [Planctomycetota bacterium]